LSRGFILAAWLGLGLAVAVARSTFMTRDTGTGSDVIDELELQCKSKNTGMKTMGRSGGITDLCLRNNNKPRAVGSWPLF
jgi:hypothetical protein